MVVFNPPLPDHAQVGDPGHISDHNALLEAAKTLNSGKIDYSHHTAKGTLVSASAASVPGTLTVGTDDMVLLVDSSQTLGLKWAQLPTGGITDSAVTTAKIADGSVTTAKIAADAVGSSEIAANAVGSSELADNAVDTAAIQDSAVTSAKIAADTITAAELAAGSVGTSELADDSVTAAKILDGTITANEIQNASITGAKLVNDTITATQIAADAVGSSELADNAVDTAAIQDSAVTSAKIADGTIVAGDVAASTFAAFGTVGNLLTANQASAESGATTGWSSNNATFTASTDRAVDGTYSFKLVTTSDATVWMGHGTGVGNYTPVTAGETYTATVDWYVPSTNTGTIGSAAGPIIYWYTAAGVYVSDIGGALGAPPEDAWTTRKVTAVAPATAAYARLFPIYTSSSYLKANDVVYIDRVGLWKGASGRWAMPGVPIPGQSAIAVNDAVDLSGTAAPEGTVSAALGSTYLQTSGAATVTGMMSWRKTSGGTGSTGWSPEGALADTGWRDVSSLFASLPAGVSIDLWLMRRVGQQIFYDIKATNTTGVARMDGVTEELPTGFRPAGVVYVALLSTDSATVIQKELTIVNGNSVRLQHFDVQTGSAWVQSSCFARDDWPTSLPGVAV